MGEWQPIETAPKDGTEILLCGPVMVDYADVCGGEGRVVVEMGSYSRTSGYRAWTDVEATNERRVQVRERYEYESWSTSMIEEPTHWMPIPSPPSAAIRADNGRSKE